MQGYYGQNLEDWFLWQLFEGQETGFYVDVGAFDGIHLSNTYLFELEGWTGICIEAHPAYFELLVQNRPDSTCIHAACVGKATVGHVPFYAEKLGLFSSLTPDQEAVERAYHWRGMQFPGFERIDVPAVTLNGVLDGQEIDLVSIDTEGGELDILRGLDLELYRPRVIVVEANTTQALDELEHYLTGRGYLRAMKAGVNHFFCADSADIPRLQKLPVLQPPRLATQHPTMRGIR
jgi:FkbM family methyltransferase